MNICIPVTNDQGLQSEVCQHFGSAPLFLIVNTDTRGTETVLNHNHQHAHGMCQPLASLQGHQLDAIVVGGIGMGALTKLQAAGIEVYLSEHATVEETLGAYEGGLLKKVTPRNACRHHGSGGTSQTGCGHDH